MSTPKFDSRLPHGEVYSSNGSAEGTAATRYIQNGHRFAANGDYIGPETESKNMALVEAPEPEENPALRIALSESDVEAIMTLDDAAALLDVGLDELARAVADRGGPTFSGSNAHRLYAAWLVKADEPERAAAAIAAAKAAPPALTAAKTEAALKAAQTPVDDPDQRRPRDGKPAVV